VSAVSMDNRDTGISWHPIEEQRQKVHFWKPRGPLIWEVPTKQELKRLSTVSYHRRIKYPDSGHDEILSRKWTPDGRPS